LERTGCERSGPDAALYSAEFFELDRGEVVACVRVATRIGDPLGEQVAARLPAGEGIQLIELPAVELALMVHEGSYVDLDQTYGLLGTVVAERGVGVPGPIREHYLVSPFHTDSVEAYRTEVCWPVFQTT
jgi:effector-binding domain-containing protein